MGLVRFNPFPDTGGNQSFALALLDESDDGFVVSSLHSRTGTRIYAKAVVGGKADTSLSTEENEAIDQARARRRFGPAPGRLREDPGAERRGRRLELRSRIGCGERRQVGPGGAAEGGSGASDQSPGSRERPGRGQAPAPARTPAPVREAPAGRASDRSPPAETRTTGRPQVGQGPEQGQRGRRSGPELRGGFRAHRSQAGAADRREPVPGQRDGYAGLVTREMSLPPASLAEMTRQSRRTSTREPPPLEQIPGLVVSPPAG